MAAGFGRPGFRVTENRCDGNKQTDGNAALPRRDFPVITALLGAGLLAAATPLWPVELHALSKIVKQESTRLAKPQAPVKEFVEGRKTLRADVNGDRREDLIVLFTLERGDLWVQYLTVLSSAGAPLATAEVSRKGVRAVDLAGTHGPVIQLATKTYASGDALCCPSVPGRASYLFRGRHLGEIKPSSAAASRGSPSSVRRARGR